MEAKVTIELSEQGQKDALARGLPAERQQVLTVPADNGDLKFFNVDNKGQLSLSLTTGAGIKRSWGASWSNLSWDVYPSADDILAYLRTRDAERAAIEAAERAEKEAKEAESRKRHEEAYAAFCALNEAEQEATLSSFYARADVNSCALEAEQYPAVAAALERRKEKKQTAAAQAERRKKIPGGPVAERAVSLSADGRCEVTIPDGKYEKSWAKHVSGVNAAQRGGYAIEGKWLDCGSKYRLLPGDVIAVGSSEWQGSRKRGSYVQTYALYVVTPVLLYRHVYTDGVAVNRTADLLALTAEERVEQALTQAVADAQNSIDTLHALDRADFDAEEIALIDERLAAWAERKTLVERALQGADPESNIIDIDSAAAAIVAAGYRELAKKNHPDAGGAAETMALITAAKAQLVEILRAAKEVK